MDVYLKINNSIEQIIININKHYIYRYKHTKTECTIKGEILMPWSCVNWNLIEISGRFKSKETDFVGFIAKNHI